MGSTSLIYGRVVKRKQLLKESHEKLCEELEASYVGNKRQKKSYVFGQNAKYVYVSGGKEVGVGG